MLRSPNVRTVLFLTISALILAAGSAASADDRGWGARGDWHGAHEAPPEVVLTAPGLSLREARHMRGAVLVERAALQNDIRALERQIEVLSAISLRARPRLRNELCHEISEMKGQLARMRKRVRRAERVDVRIEHVRRPKKRRRGHARHAATAHEFQSVKRAIVSTPYSNDRMLTLQSIAKTQRFTTAQARELAALFPYSKQRVDALALLYARVVDPHNYHETYSLLAYSSDRRKLMHRIGVI